MPAPLRPEWFGYVVLFAGVMLHLCLGSVYCWGNLTTYVTSYLRKKSPDLHYSDTLWVYLAGPSSQAVMVFLGGYLQLHLGTRLTSFLGSVMCVSGVYLTASVIEHGYVAMIFSYGVIFGLGMGTAYTCPIAAAITYLPKYKGIINGTVVMGFGLGAFVMNFIITGYANPHNCKPQCPGPFGTYPKFHCPGWSDVHFNASSDVDCDNKYFPPTSDVAQRVPDLLRLLATIYACVMLSSSLLIVGRSQPLIGFLSKSSEEDIPTGDAGSDIQEDLKQETEQVSRFEAKGDIKTIDVMKTRLGWLLWIGFLLTGTGGSFVVAQYKTYGQKYSWSTDNIEARISSIMSVGNAVGRLVHGALADRFGFTIVLGISAALSAGFQLTLALTGHHEYLFATWCFIIAFLYGGNFALYPTGTLQLFGKKYFPPNYGFFFSGFGIGGVIIGVVNKSLVDSIGFSGMTIIIGGITSVGVVNTFFVHRAQKKPIYTSVPQSDDDDEEA